MSVKDINELKLTSWQNDIKGIVSQFRTALNQHFDVVKFKSKKLIDTRWENVKTEV